MKTVRKPSRQASVLLVVLMISAIFSLFAAYYFRSVSQQHKSIVRSQMWNSSIPLADAAIEEALSHLNRNCRDEDDYNTPGVLPPGATKDDWKIGEDPSNLTVQKTRSFGDGFYRVVIDFADANKPAVYSEGFTENRLVSLNSSPLLGSITTSQYGALEEFDGKKVNEFVPRAVWAVARMAPLFEGAIAADGLVDMNGNNVLTDSFDSKDKNRSNNGKYKPGVGAKGNVATNGKVVDVGNADIKGKVRTGEGGEVEIKNGGTVGDIGWTGPGVQEGYHTEDMNQAFDPAELPLDWNPGGGPLLNTKIGTVTYAQVFTGGDYVVDYLDGKVYIKGSSRILVKKGIDMTGQEGIWIATNAMLKIYAACPTTKMGGNGIVNADGSALSFQYYGLPSNTSVTITGNGSFAGTIYAPNADLTLKGGGSTNEDFVGAVICKTATIDGNFQFHYDEAIGPFGPKSGYKIVEWREVAVNTPEKE